MTDDTSRQQAIQRLHQRRGFINYIIGAVVISLFMVLIWDRRHYPLHYRAGWLDFCSTTGILPVFFWVIVAACLSA